MPTRLTHKLLFLLHALGLALLTGCASFVQGPVALDQQALTTTPGKIGVVMAPLPVPSVAIEGAGCVLCYLFAKNALSELNEHAGSLPVDDLLSLKAEVVDALRARGLDAEPIDEVIDFTTFPDVEERQPDHTSKDLRALRSKYGIERLLIISVHRLGFHRLYSSYFPRGNPRGELAGSGEMIELSTGRFEWLEPVYAARDVAGEWDEPPSFPGLTNAYYQAMEAGRDAFLNVFSAPNQAAPVSSR